MSHAKRAAAAVVVSIALGGCAVSSPQAPPTHWDGLELRDTGASGALYVQPHAASKAYRTVVLEPLVVKPSKGWHPTRNLVTQVVIGRHPPRPQELEHIERAIGPRFHAMLAAALAQGGYLVSDRSGDDSVRVHLALTNVFMDTTEHAERGVPDPGAMTLVLEVADAASGQALARLVDEQTGRFGSLEFPNTVNDSRDYRAAVEGWGNRLCAILDDINTAPAASAPSSR